MATTFFFFSIKLKKTRWNRAIKFEAARMHFSSDVLVAVAVVVL